MTMVGETCMGRESQGPNERLSAFLMRQYRRDHRIPRLAEDVGCTQKAAENMLNGHWPNGRLWVGIVRRFGRDVVDAVFGPDIDETVSRLEREVRELEQQLQAKRARLIQAESPMARAPGAVAEAHQLTEPRTFKTEEPSR